MACDSGPSALEATLERAAVPVEAVDSVVPEVEVRPAPAQPATTPPEVGAAAEVVLVWDGISPLHQSFFAHTESVRQLSQDLGPWITDTANVYIRFDSGRHIGRIELRLLPGQGVGLAAGEGTRVDMYRLSPVMQALARYRSSVAARFDTRVQAFKIGIESFRGSVHCRFGVAGKPPPDGTVLDLCVQINGEAMCGEPITDGVAFDESVAKTVRACLG